MQHIIVPTDFSIKSYNALIIAKRIARKCHARIHLIHFVEPLLSNYANLEHKIEDQLIDQYIHQLAERINAELLSLKNLHEEEGVEIRTEIKIGDPFQQLKKLLKSITPDLVVLGAKGITDAEDFFLGSFTEKVVQSIFCPVIVVKEIIDDHDFKDIVYALDLKDENKTMLEFLKKLQALFGSTIHLVKINTRKNFRNDIDNKADLKKFAQKHELTNVTISCFSHEDEEYGIVYFADEKNADLIAMGIHEKSGVRRLISGGALAMEVTEHTFRSVLTCRI